MITSNMHFQLSIQKLFHNLHPSTIDVHMIIYHHHCALPVPLSLEAYFYIIDICPSDYMTTNNMHLKHFCNTPKMHRWPLLSVI